MKARVKQGNVLDGKEAWRGIRKEAALCITIDGSGPDIEGNVGRQFSRRYPELWQEIREELQCVKREILAH